MTETATPQLYEIKSWLTGAVLFSGRFGSLRMCMEAAVAAGVSLDGARLDGANLASANLDGASLCGAILRGASLDGARLDGANLASANLDGASLCGANLVCTRLDGASLCGANLVCTRLDGAILRGASLDGARLDGASLVGASLFDAILARASDIILLGRPNGWPAYAYRERATIRAQVGCHNRTVAEGREDWAGKKDRCEVLAALAYAEAVAAIRGWTFEAEV